MERAPRPSSRWCPDAVNRARSGGGATLIEARVPRNAGPGAARDVADERDDALEGEIAAALANPEEEPVRSRAALVENVFAEPTWSLREQANRGAT